MKIPLTLGRALAKLDELGGHAEWNKFAMVPTSGNPYNAFNRLRKRGWIEDDGTVKKYQDGEEYTGPRFPRYRMTAAGREAMAVFKGEK